MKKAIFIFIAVLCVQLSKAQCTGKSITINATNNTSASWPGGWTSLTVRLQTNFTVLAGATFTIDNCELIAEPGVQIIVNSVPGALGTLIITTTNPVPGCTTHIYANPLTGQMWDGIFLNGVSGGGGWPARVIVNANTIIEDAETAINVGQWGYFNIDNATFNKNYFDIADFDANINVDISSRIQNSRFWCKDIPFATGNDGNWLLAPHAGAYKNTCIYLNHPVNSESPTPLSFAPNNQFDYAGNGIYIQQGATYIGNSTFEDIFGSAIECQFDNFITIEDNFITRCRWGINSHDLNYYVLIDDNLITECAVAIWNHDNNIGDCIIRNNTINDVSIGVNSTFNPNLDLSIYSNTLTNNYHPNTSTAIYVTEAALSANATYDIYDNTLKDWAHGIHCIMLFQPRIHDNWDPGIEVNDIADPSYQTFGIRVDDCEAAFIHHNKIVSCPACTTDIGYEDPLHSNAIMVFNSTGRTVETCNDVGDIGKGLWFGGFTPTCYIAANVMNHCFDQFYLYDNFDGLCDRGASQTQHPPQGFAHDSFWLVGGDHHSQTLSNQTITDLVIQPFIPVTIRFMHLLIIKVLVEGSIVQQIFFLLME